MTCNCVATLVHILPTNCATSTPATKDKKTAVPRIPYHHHLSIFTTLPPHAKRKQFYTKLNHSHSTTQSRPRAHDDPSQTKNSRPIHVTCNTHTRPLLRPETVRGGGSKAHPLPCVIITHRPTAVVARRGRHTHNTPAE